MKLPIGSGPRGPLEPRDWPRASGFSHGVAAEGRIVSVAGQVGWNPITSLFESDDLVAQTRQALANVVAVLAAGGATPADVVRLTWYMTDKRAYRAARHEIGEAYRAIFGRHYPAMTLIVAGLLEDRAKVEIEATAVVCQGSPGAAPAER